MSNIKEYPFPVMSSDRRLDSLTRLAKLIITSYEEYIYPSLFRFGLLDDEHIEKYLSSPTMEDIYKDAMKGKERESLIYLEKQRLFSNIDIWESLRDPASTADSPKEEGFIFKPMPYHETPAKTAVLKALSVKDCKIEVNNKVLAEISVIKPTAKQKELFNRLSEFMEWAKKNNLSKSILSYFYTDTKGETQVSVRAILGVLWCTEIKDYKK